ncbi:MAG TPA: hypothetical protein VHS55_09245 [Solirubrobacteraceae bacterium]|jgi:hypothetical protein|nr:hypothetical protein [Solirubrobacteraceae bacterium]
MLRAASVARLTAPFTSVPVAGALSAVAVFAMTLAMFGFTCSIFRSAARAVITTFAAVALAMT